MPISVQSHQIELVMQNTVERIEISISDTKGRPMDPTNLKLNILDVGNNLISSDTLYPTDSATQIPSRITRVGRGRYYFPFGMDNCNGYPATLRSPLPPSAPYDLSSNNILQFAIDNKPYISVTINAANPASATPAEIVSQVNAALVASADYGESYAYSFRYYVGEFFITSPSVLVPSMSRVQLNTTVTNSASQAIFGNIPNQDIRGPVFGDPCVCALLSNRTQGIGDVLFHWEVLAQKGLEKISLLQVVKISTPKAYAILPYFRLEMDKAIKEVGRDDARTGFTDAQLMQYLYLAVSELNALQPVTNLTIDSFPTNNLQILLYSALLLGLISQGLYAVDTDINYSDRGASFQIDHSSKLQSYANMIASRLQATVTQFKLQYASVGTVKYEAMYGMRTQALLDASPAGALFRGLLTRG